MPNRPTKGAVRVARIITNGRIKAQKTGRYLDCERGKKSVIGVADMIDREAGLGQALDALRAILPYAQQELEGLHACKHDDIEVLGPEAARADAAVEAAHAAIDLIDPPDKPLLVPTPGGAS